MPIACECAILCFECSVVCGGTRSGHCKKKTSAFADVFLFLPHARTQNPQPPGVTGGCSEPVELHQRKHLRRQEYSGFERNFATV